MQDIKKNWPLGLVFLSAVIVTGLAGWQAGEIKSLSSSEAFGIVQWFAPLGYLLLYWLFAGPQKLNRPMIALGAVLVYGLSAFLLFVPAMPTGLQWHYPIGVAALVLLFIS